MWCRGYSMFASETKCYGAKPSAVPSLSLGIIPLAKTWTPSASSHQGIFKRYFQRGHTVVHGRWERGISCEYLAGLQQTDSSTVCPLQRSKVPAGKHELWYSFLWLKTKAQRLVFFTKPNYGTFYIFVSLRTGKSAYTIHKRIPTLLLLVTEEVHKKIFSKEKKLP